MVPAGGQRKHIADTLGGGAQLAGVGSFRGGEGVGLNLSCLEAMLGWRVCTLELDLKVKSELCQFLNVTGL